MFLTHLLPKNRASRSQINIRVWKSSQFLCAVFLLLLFCCVFLCCVVLCCVVLLVARDLRSVCQGRICSDKCTCCYIEVEVTEKTFCLTQSQYINAEYSSTYPLFHPLTVCLYWVDKSKHLPFVSSCSQYVYIVSRRPSTYPLFHPAHSMSTSCREDQAPTLCFIRSQYVYIVSSNPSTYPLFHPLTVCLHRVDQIQAPTLCFILLTVSLHRVVKSKHLPLVSSAHSMPTSGRQVQAPTLSL